MYGANNAGCDEVSGGASLPYDRQFIIGTVRATASERLWKRLDPDHSPAEHEADWSQLSPSKRKGFVPLFALTARLRVVGKTLGHDRRDDQGR